jgi:hypothetical protein
MVREPCQISRLKERLLTRLYHPKIAGKQQVLCTTPSRSATERVGQVLGAIHYHAAVCGILRHSEALCGLVHVHNSQHSHVVEER